MWPLLLIAWAAVDYVTVPELSGNNGVMFVGCVVVGVLFGIGCAMFTRVYWENGTYKVQATGLALFFWLLGVGGRLVFGIFAEHGGGGADLYLFHEPRLTLRNLGNSTHIDGVVRSGESGASATGKTNKTRCRYCTRPR